MLAAPIAKPEWKTSSTALVTGRSFMIGVSRVFVVDCTRTQSYYRRDFAAPDHLARDLTRRHREKGHGIAAVAPVIQKNFG
jgi:hypothetical protein